MSVQPNRKSSKEFLLGMMGVEKEAVDQIMRGMRKNGIKKEIAEKRARTFVNKVKRRCVETLHQLYTSYKEGTKQ